MTVGRKQKTDGYKNYAHADNTEYRGFDKTPSVGQSRPYKSGDNAHGRHERSRGGNAEPDHDGGSSGTQEHMIPSKSSKR